jgi:uncharacterized repeat protein (TIGR03803 family)
MDSQGNLYGTTRQGGPDFNFGTDDYGTGTLFKYSPAGGIQTLASFFAEGSADGAGFEPQGGILPDGAGGFYGTTSYGYDCGGTVFHYTPAAGLTTLAAFTYPENPGVYPMGAIAVDGKGNVYGTTVASSGEGYGTIFKCTPSGELTTLALFQDPAPTDSLIGETPYGVVIDNQGNLYGTTSAGGANGDGTIFEYSSSGSVTTLASFDGANGQEPEGTLIVDGAGNLYGTTFEGGPGGHGTVFEYSASGGLQTLAAFDGTNGASPTGLVMDGNGNIYGSTCLGGQSDSYYGFGTIYELVPTFPMSGTISLQGCAEPAQTLTFTFRRGVAQPFTQNVTLASDGSYTLSAVPNGTYTVAIKGPKWLQKDVTGVVVNGGAISGINATLLPGDANGDNVVDINDFSILAAAFGSDASMSNWNTNADFNCDGVVDIQDFSLLAANFGMVGDP